jgi:rhodanese-related sulfurtransferase
MIRSSRWMSETTGRDKVAVTFMQMADAAMAEVSGASPAEVRQKLDEDAEALIVDVRDAAELPSTGLAVRGVNISLGNLPVKADLELPEDWRDSRLQDRARQVVTTCQTGQNAARGAKLLKDMGFENVSYMVGGMEAWKAAGLPTD